MSAPARVSPARLWPIAFAILWSLCGPGGGGPSASQAQSTEAVSIQFAAGEDRLLEIRAPRGYPVFAAGDLESLGWQTGRDGAVHRLMHRTGLELRFVPGSPYFRWEGELHQLVDPPHVYGEDLQIPLQLLADFFPALLPDAYRWDGRRLHVAESPRVDPEQTTDRPERALPRLVIIDPGHGGDDPGALGPGGVREKEVALAIALALRRELSSVPDLEVRMTRERDELVPIWERGERATEWKGDRPGLFLSIHANALADRPGVRGFETYFLSEARTEHERRVAAAENAPLLRETDDPDAPVDPALAGILSELRTFDHQQWSSLLADLVQRELGGFHPGSDRGVKQGPFAVLTNALMPSVLVEVGFLTNPQEERLLMRPEFHRDTARAIRTAIEEFFDRYPAAGG